MAGKLARMRDGTVIDLSSTNSSFKSVARDLKILGIKNYYFMLELNDFSLTKINPHAKNKDGSTALTKNEIERVLNECVINPWYFLREVVRIPDQGGTVVPYRANRGNIAQTWCMYHGVDSWLCLPRQQGKTTSAIAFFVWAFLFGTSNSKFIFTHKDGEGAKNNLKTLLDILHELPEYMQCRSIVTEEDGKREKAKENATVTTNPVNGNMIITKAKAISKDRAASLARGMSAPVLFQDEPEFTDFIDTIVSNSVSTYETAARNAKRNGALYCRCFTCTPGDLDSRAGQQAQTLLDKTYPWSEKFYDRGAEELIKTMEAQGENCNTITYIEYQYNQIGLDDAWFERISQKIGNPLDVRREILLQRLHGSSLSPWPQEDIEYITSTVHAPIDELWLNTYYRFDIYKALDKGIPYLVGVDCSTGTNKDNNAITILNPYTVQPDAEFECSFIGETAFEELLKSLCRELPRAVLCIERNSVGDSVIDHLLHSEFSTRLYFDKNLNLLNEKYKMNTTVESMLKKEASKKTYYGVYTDGPSRKDMFAILSDRIAEYKDDFIAKNVIRDISRLVKTSSGKIVAGPEFHDDSIMSYLIAMYVYTHGNNLELFGIHKGLDSDYVPNQGMKRPEEIDPTLVDPKLIAGAIRQEQQKNALSEWEKMQQIAIRNSQKTSYELAKKGLVNNIYSENPDAMVYEDGFEFGQADMDFFDELNGMGKYSKNGFDNPYSLQNTGSIWR